MSLFELSTEPPDRDQEVTITPDPEPISLVVYGKAITQGSKSGFINKATGRVVLREGSTAAANAAHKDWRSAVAREARDWRANHDEPLIDRPVLLACRFYMQRPASAPKRRRTWPIGARSGDLDKLVRAIGDALTSTLLTDDSRIVALLASKDYGDPPRCEIEVMPVASYATGVTLQHRFVL